ncbi:hypothetical protein, partial [Vibrio owensii]|uniref:hypothetical protein n=1 Tax=Vibrio owensii TaxID=696485 RepID=UPI001A7E1E9E
MTKIIKMISAFLTISMAGVFSASASPIELEQSTLLLIPSAIMMLLLPYLLFIIFKLKRSRQQLRISEPVSYTHLTLPTTLST